MIVSASRGRSGPPTSGARPRVGRYVRSSGSAGTSPGRASLQRSASGVASARNGRHRALPGRVSPAQASIARITSSPWCSSATNGIGGQGMTFAIVDSSSGAASAAAMNPATSRPWRAGRACRRDRRRPGQAVLEPGRDAEVAAAAADRPEQVRVDARVDTEHLAIGGDDLGGEQVVDREAVLADEVADAAAERDPAEPHRSRVAEARREAVLGGRRRVLARGQAGLGPGRPRRRRRCRAPCMSRRSSTIPPSIVLCPAPLWPPLRTTSSEAGFARERDDVGDVLGVRRPDDDQRPAIDAAHHDGPASSSPRRRAR